MAETFDEIMERMKKDADICNSKLNLKSTYSLNMGPIIIKTRFDKEDKVSKIDRARVFDLLSDGVELPFKEIQAKLNIKQGQLQGHLKTLKHLKKINNRLWATPSGHSVWFRI